MNHSLQNKDVWLGEPEAQLILCPFSCFICLYKKVPGALPTQITESPRVPVSAGSLGTHLRWLNLAKANRKPGSYVGATLLGHRIFLRHVGTGMKEICG